MEVKNGIIIDGVLHEFKDNIFGGCDKCSLNNFCSNRNSLPPCVMFSQHYDILFVNRDKVKVEKEETE